MFCIIMSYWSSRNRFKKGSQKVNEELIMKRKEEEAKVAPGQTRPFYRRESFIRNTLIVAELERGTESELESEILQASPPLLQIRLSERRYSM